MSNDSSCDALYVDSNEQLSELCTVWKQASFLALDTEFIRTDTFYPIAGLLQLSDGSEAFLIDPLSIDKWGPFVALMLDESIPKVLHSCSEDLEVFERLFSVLPKPIFDTQIAAAMLGLGFSLSYQRLVDSMLSIHVEKGETRSNWLQRPLTSSQCHYAALDVEYLPEVYRRLNDQLVEKSRQHWLAQECQQMLAAFYVNDAYYKKIKSAWKLSPGQLFMLDKLTQWRELQARERDVPRGRVIKDRSCYDIALQAPKSLAALSKISEVGPKTLRVDGQNILDIVVASQSGLSTNFPKPLAKPLPIQMGNVLKRLKTVTLSKAEALDVAPEILVKKRDYEALLRSGMGGGSYQLPLTLSGWRKEVIGDDLLAFLADSA